MIARLRMIRPRRRRVYGSIIAGLWLIAVIAVAAWPTAPTVAPYLSEWPSDKPGARSYTTFGLTHWLYVARLDAPDGTVSRRVRTDNTVILDVVLYLGLATVGAWFAYAGADRLFRMRGRCDRCAYDFTHLTSDRCPECGHPVPTPPDAAA